MGWLEEVVYQMAWTWLKWLGSMAVDVLDTWSSEIMTTPGTARPMIQNQIEYANGINVSDVAVKYVFSDLQSINQHRRRHQLD